eukprot:m.45497 g.45497  ORF g.45497 m.45497 type:complete len:118 (-) comp11784_c0_seq3:8-361(-)
MLLQLGSRFLTTTAVVAGLRATVQGALRRFTTTTMANTGVGDVGAVVAAARAASIDGLQAANLKRRLLAGEKLYGAGSVTCCNSAVEASKTANKNRASIKRNKTFMMTGSLQLNPQR